MFQFDSTCQEQLVQISLIVSAIWLVVLVTSLKISRKCLLCSSQLEEAHAEQMETQLQPKMDRDNISNSTVNMETPSNVYSDKDIDELYKIINTNTNSSNNDPKKCSNRKNGVHDHKNSVSHDFSSTNKDASMIAAFVDKNGKIVISHERGENSNYGNPDHVRETSGFSVEHANSEQEQIFREFLGFEPTMTASTLQQRNSGNYYTYNYNYNYNHNYNNNYNHVKPNHNHKISDYSILNNYNSKKNIRLREREREKDKDLSQTRTQSFHPFHNHGAIFSQTSRISRDPMQHPQTDLPELVENATITTVDATRIVHVIHDDNDNENDNDNEDGFEFAMEYEASETNQSDQTQLQLALSPAPSHLISNVNGTGVAGEAGAHTRTQAALGVTYAGVNGGISGIGGMGVMGGMTGSALPLAMNAFSRHTSHDPMITTSPPRIDGEIQMRNHESRSMSRKESAKRFHRRRIRNSGQSGENISIEINGNTCHKKESASIEVGAVYLNTMKNKEQLDAKLQNLALNSNISGQKIINNNYQRILQTRKNSDIRLHPPTLKSYTNTQKNGQLVSSHDPRGEELYGVPVNSLSGKLRKTIILSLTPRALQQSVNEGNSSSTTSYAPFENWHRKDVCNWLKNCFLNEFLDKFENNKGLDELMNRIVVKFANNLDKNCDGVILLALDEEMLESIGVSKMNIYYKISELGQITRTTKNKNDE